MKSDPDHTAAYVDADAMDRRNGMLADIGSVDEVRQIIDFVVAHLEFIAERARRVGGA